MDTFELLGSTLGLSFLAGIRLYLTVLAVGLGVRFGLFHLPAPLSGLEVLAHPAVLVTAGVACAAEFVSDKIPWFDSLWDSVHTFIRPIGAAVLGATALSSSMDPPMRAVLALVCGGIALSSHSTKAATRVAVNHSPEPFSNIGMSLVGDVAAPAGVWLALSHPLVMLGIVAVALVIFAFIARFIVRKLRSVLARIGFGRPERTVPPDLVRSESR